MYTETTRLATAPAEITNGAGATAVLAAGVGCFCVGFLALLADKSAVFKSSMIFFRPTGPLSGVTTSAILVWLGAWALLHVRWRGKTVALGRIHVAAFLMLALALLLTFPPLADLL